MVRYSTPPVSGSVPDSSIRPRDQQGADHPVDVHPAHRGDPRAGDRLPVGDHRQGLQRGAGELGPLAVEQQPLHERGVHIAGVHSAIPAPTSPQVDPATAVGVAVAQPVQRLDHPGHRLTQRAGQHVLARRAVDDQQQRLQRGVELIVAEQRRLGCSGAARWFHQRGFVHR